MWPPLLLRGGGGGGGVWFQGEKQGRFMGEWRGLLLHTPWANSDIIMELQIYYATVARCREWKKHTRLTPKTNDENYNLRVCGRVGQPRVRVMDAMLSGRSLYQQRGGLPCPSLPPPGSCVSGDDILKASGHTSWLKCVEFMQSFLAVIDVFQWMTYWAKTRRCYREGWCGKGGIRRKVMCISLHLPPLAHWLHWWMVEWRWTRK